MVYIHTRCTCTPRGAISTLPGAFDAASGKPMGDIHNLAPINYDLVCRLR